MRFETVEYTKSVVFPEIKEGRGGYDLDHTKAVMYYIEQIFEHEKELTKDLNLEYMLIAACCHDWGYTKEPYDVFSKTRQLQKKMHMIVGAQKTEKLLKNSAFDKLSSAAKKRIVHLVSIHDEYPSLKDTDELVLMEADTLGSLDTDLAKPNFTKEQNEFHIKKVQNGRFKKFITNYSKNIFPILLEKRIDYYK